jgi:ferredoxin
MYLYPGLIEADDDGWPRILVTHPEGKQLEDAQDAADICPTGAIALEDRDE